VGLRRVWPDRFLTKYVEPQCAAIAIEFLGVPPASIAPAHKARATTNKSGTMSIALEVMHKAMIQISEPVSDLHHSQALTTTTTDGIVMAILTLSQALDRAQAGEIVARWQAEGFFGKRARAAVQKITEL
jgi:hypothetical protein